MSEYSFVKANNPRKLIKELRLSSVGSLFSALMTAGDDITVVMSTQLDSSQEDALNAVIIAHTVDVSASDTVSSAIDRATDFGKVLIGEFTVENVMMGITQTGKVAAVTTYLHNLAHYISTGSLYQAITELDTLIAQGIPAELSPFVTEQRMLDYKAKIQTYLGNS